MSRILITPALTGALLYALTASPDNIREPLLARLQEYLSPTNISRAITALKWLTAYGFVRKAHEWLSDLAQNNYRLRSEKHRYDWPNEIAVITGGTGGFGSLMAKELASNGVNVICVDIRDGLPADMEKNPKIHYIKCDVTDRQAVADMAQQIRQRHGHPSILINNAGISGEGAIFDQTQKSLEAIFKLNVISHYYTAQEFLPDMAKNKKGHVVTLASMASFVTPAGLVPYANTKVAALGFHEGMKWETRVVLNAPEVKFSVVHPTFAATPMTQPYNDVLTAGAAQVIRPEMVTNAVVKQILSGRGKQIIVAGNAKPVVHLRSMPWWIQDFGLMLGDKSIKPQLEAMKTRRKTNY